MASECSSGTCPINDIKDPRKRKKILIIHRDRLVQHRKELDDKIILMTEEIEAGGK
jgi:hypothetical protein